MLKTLSDFDYYFDESFTGVEINMDRVSYWHNHLYNSEKLSEIFLKSNNIVGCFHEWILPIDLSKISKKDFLKINN